MTFPNQRSINIHREKPKADFLGIKNENWKAASRNLSAHSFLLYIYLAANADNYSLALSPAAVRQEIGMARSTFHDQFHILVDKGYLVHSHGNTYDFYEVPQTSGGAEEKSPLLADGLTNENCPSVEIAFPQDEQRISSQNTEINNSQEETNKVINITQDNEAKQQEQQMKDREELINSLLNKPSGKFRF